MTRISYFQRYSKKENHVTNNTLLLLRYFYQASPEKFGTVLSELTNEDVSVGLVFEQQVRFHSSVPDALISQAPLDIYIETKHGGELDPTQIRRHLSSIGNNSNHPAQKVLFGLTSAPIDKTVSDELVLSARSNNIIFRPITFAEMLSSLRFVCEDHETVLRDVIADYENYLEKEGLLQVGEILSAFPVGWTIHKNIKHKIYFEPCDRPSKASSDFIGLYRNKCIEWLASISTVVSGVGGPENFSICTTETGELTNEEEERIRGAIADFPNLADQEHRYYLFGDVCETEFKKGTRYGMRNRRDFNLSNWLDYDNKRRYSLKEVAEGLRGEEWE